MITLLRGRLESLGETAAVVCPEGGLGYRVLLPAFLTSRLSESLGQQVTLHTLHFLESQAQGANMLPRLAGFASEADRDFFELFTTCKGLGFRRALRAMSLPPAQIAAAITDRDASMLQSLPEIGRRIAETIIATLHGKVEPFLEGPAAPASPGVGSGGGEGPAGGREALELLLQLGENRAQAIAWIDQAQRAAPEGGYQDLQDLVAAVYRIKHG